MRKVINCLTILLAVFAVLTCGREREQQSSQVGHAAPPGKMTLILQYDSLNADTISGIAGDSTVVLDFLRTVCDSMNIDLDTRKFSFGELVTRIGERTSGDGGQWFYRVNGEMAKEGAHSKQIVTGDTVEFFFREE